MNNQQPIMERMLVLLLSVYAIGLWIGEGLRDHPYGEAIRTQEDLPAGET